MFTSTCGVYMCMYCLHRCDVIRCVFLFICSCDISYMLPLLLPPDMCMYCLHRCDVIRCVFLFICSCDISYMLPLLLPPDVSVISQRWSRGSHGRGQRCVLQHD